MTNQEHVESIVGPAAADASFGVVVDSLPAMIWVTGPLGCGVYFNAAWLAFTGRSLEDELGGGWLRGIHPADLEAVVSMFTEAGSDPFEMDYRLRDGDGAYRWMFSRCLQRLSCDGSFVGHVGAAMDVTDRREIEAERTVLLAEANEANARLAALQELTARLASLELPGEVAEVVLGQGVDELGGRTGSLCLLTDDGEYLEVAAQVGYSAEVTGAWGRFPLEALTPAGDAVRLGVGVYVSSLTELHARYPIFMGSAIVGDEAIAVLPLTAAGAGTLGAMVIGFARSREFPPDDRRLLTALAAQAATALARTRSRAAVEAARGEAEAGRAQLAYLADASAHLAASLDLDDTLATVADLAVPRLADRCSLYLLGQGRVETLLLAPASPDVDIRTFLDRFPVDLTAKSGVAAVLRTGQPEFAPVVDEGMLAATAQSPEHLELLRRIGFGAALILPLRARGRLLGALALTNRAGHAMTEQDRTLALELTARAAVAIDNARLFAERDHVACRLQASLLPPALPAIAGLDLAARYAPADETLEVGGDFYDCIPSGDDRWLLVVGDVKGKGIDAAVLTGMARHTIRGAAIRGAGPVAVLSHLNEMLIRHEMERTDREAGGWEALEPRFCTVVAIALARTDDGFQAAIACAGHPLPLLRQPDGHVVSIGRPGTVLGIDPVIEVAEVTVSLRAGALLACFTDGVSECHEGDHFFDETGIADVLASASGDAARVIHEIETAARRFTPGGAIRDDMAIVVARLPA